MLEDDFIELAFSQQKTNQNSLLVLDPLFVLLLFLLPERIEKCLLMTRELSKLGIISVRGEK